MSVAAGRRVGCAGVLEGWTIGRAGVKEFRCGDVIPGCGVCFLAGSVREVEVLAQAHARDDHGLLGPEMPPDITARIRAAIHDAPAADPGRPPPRPPSPRSTS